MAKMILDMAGMRKDFFEDTALIGIGTALPGYRLCWMLNRFFYINFIRDPEQVLSLQRKDNPFYFPIYRYDLPGSSHKYLLYQLKSGSESLLPEAKKMDYLWLVQTANPEEDAFALTRELRNIPDVQLAQILYVDQLKNLNNLLV